MLWCMTAKLLLKTVSSRRAPRNVETQDREAIKRYGSAKKPKRAKDLSTDKDKRLHKLSKGKGEYTLVQKLKQIQTYDEDSLPMLQAAYHGPICSSTNGTIIMRMRSYKAASPMTGKTSMDLQKPQRNQSNLLHHGYYHSAVMRKYILQMYRSNQQVNSVTPSCETCGGPHFYYECQTAGGYTQDVYATLGTYNAGSNSYQPQVLRQLLISNQNQQAFNKSLQNEMTEMKKVLLQRPQARPSVSPPTPSSSIELNKEKLQDKSDIQVHKFFQMFKKLHFIISLAEALALMPKYHKMLKDLLSDKEKLLGLANTSLIENCSAVLLKNLPEKLGDPRKYLIPFDFPKLEKCMALADLGASINLMPLSIGNKLMLPELVPTRMTLELANRFIAYPAGIAEDVFVQVGKFTFLDAFVVVKYDVDLRVPLILERPFLRTARALVDVYEEELILRDGDEKLIFHADNI
ncbi:reverse transcriptase domain-containing protein [Tanacetum coccineum]